MPTTIAMPAQFGRRLPVVTVLIQCFEKLGDSRLKSILTVAVA